MLQLDIEVIRWETHGYPAGGSDPQAILNEQLGDNYDIFIGILGSRFGTPTPRAESGTEEEFRRACQSRTVSGSRPEVMLYFKEAQLPYDVNIEQVAKIRVFRDMARRLGFLDWSFIEVEEFEALLRTHLSRALQKMARTWRDAPGRAGVSLGTSATDVSADLQEMSELSASESARGTRATERVTFLTNQMTELLNAETARLTAITKTGTPSDVLAFRQRSAERVAKGMDEFAERLRIELPTFRLSRASGSRAYGRVAAIISALLPGGVALSHLNSLLQASTNADQATVRQLETLAEYRATVAKMSPFTETLDRAKKNYINALAAYEVELTISSKLLREVIDSITDMIKLASSSGPASTPPPALRE